MLFVYWFQSFIKAVGSNSIIINLTKNIKISKSTFMYCCYLSAAKLDSQLFLDI